MRRFFKLLALTLAGGILIGVFAIFESRVCFDGAENYRFFVGNTSKDCAEICIKNNAAGAKLLFNVCGECAEYDSLDIPSFLQKYDAEIIFTETLSDSVNYYCKASLPYSVCLYGEKINLHICVRADKIIAASPIIFGGY